MCVGGIFSREAVSMLKQKMLSLTLDPETGQPEEKRYEFTVLYRRRVVVETEIKFKGDGENLSEESLFLKGLDALNIPLQTQLASGLNTDYLHVHFGMISLHHFNAFQNDKFHITIPIPHKFLLEYLAANKIKLNKKRGRSWLWTNCPPENRKFSREVGRLHLWENPRIIDFASREKFQISLKECVSGSESPAVFQQGEIKTPQIVFFFVIIELKRKFNRIELNRTFSSGISTVAYKDPSYAKLDSFIYINRLLKTNNQKASLAIRIYRRTISRDYDVSTAGFAGILLFKDCVSEARVVTLKGGDYGTNWWGKASYYGDTSSLMIPGRHTGIFLAEEGEQEAD